uniref:C-type lectin domain-containing protein n=1 Tax=Panagrolaimus sp. JU765 TaxID=591449 RepID=A0AC34QGC2_9BILA
MIYPVFQFFVIFFVQLSFGAPTGESSRIIRSAPARRVCPEGSDKSIRDLKCFLYVPDQKSFVDAQSYCQSQNGNLASITNGFDNHLIADHARSKFQGQWVFLGASVINSDSGTWTWFDDSHVKFTNWLTPVLASELQFHQCAAMNPLNRGKWHVVDCFRKLPFVCEIPLIDEQ